MPIAIPSICLYIILLKLNYNDSVAKFINSMKTRYQNEYKIPEHISIVSLNGRHVKKLLISTECMSLLSESKGEFFYNIIKNEELFNTMN